MGLINKLFSCLSGSKQNNSQQTQKGMKKKRQSIEQSRADIISKQQNLEPTSMVQQNQDENNQSLHKGQIKETQEVQIKQNDLSQSTINKQEQKKKQSSSQLQSSARYQENNEENTETQGNDKNFENQNNISSGTKQKQNEQEFSDKKISTQKNTNNYSSRSSTSGNINQQSSKVSQDYGDSKTINNPESNQTSQSQIRTKNHKYSNVTDHGSLDSTKVSLNQSTVTTNYDFGNSQEEYAKIDKQIKYIKSLKEHLRAQEEENIIFAYINNTQAFDCNVLSFEWAQKFSDHIKEKKIMNLPIDNSTIIDKDGNIKSGLKLKRDYLLVSNQVWYFLTQLYGGGPHIIFDNNIKKLKKLNFDPYRLENTSNFCYMNALVYISSINQFYLTGLQSIFSIGELNTYFFEKRYLEFENTKTKKRFKFTHAYSEQLEKFTRCKMSQIVNPQVFRKYSSQNFDPYEQHDAQEYLRFVLGEIQDELNLPLPEKRPSEFKDSESAQQFYFKYHTSIVDKLFCGQLISKVQCQKCKYISNTFDPFLDLSLPIESKNLKDVNSCLDNFFKAEEIDGDYKCEKCKKTSRAIKSCELGKVPKYLVIHLKRFKMFPTKTKIKQKISYPQTIDIHKYCTNNINENTTYQLADVIIHSGTAEYGHYVSFNKRGEQVNIDFFMKINWFFCDDDNIQECNNNDALDQEAYLLFYERND